MDDARRAVECLGWGWLAGMMDLRGYRLVSVRPMSGLWVAVGPDGVDRFFRPILPDLSDPLTALGLLHLVREAWGDPGMSTLQTCAEFDYWIVQRGQSGRRDEYGGDITGEQSGEAEALVAALELAP